MNSLNDGKSISSWSLPAIQSGKKWVVPLDLLKYAGMRTETHLACNRISLPLVSPWSAAEHLKLMKELSRNQPV
jgi:hypothetical protein